MTDRTARALSCAEQAFGEDFGLLHAERTEHHTPSGAVQPFAWGVLRLAG